MTEDVRTPRTPLKSLKEALRERLSPEQFSRIFGDSSRKSSSQDDQSETEG